MNYSAKAVLLSNFAPSEHFRSGSFTDILHEEARWDVGAFWALDKAIRELHKPGLIAGGDHELIWPVFRIYSFLSLTLRAHCDPNDCFEIRDMDPEIFPDWCERLQLTFEGFMKGDMPQDNLFDLENPTFASE